MGNRTSLIMLAIAAWRSRSLAWWQAALIGVGVLLGFAADEGPVVVLFTLPLSIGLLLAARKLANTKRTVNSPHALVGGVLGDVGDP